MAIFNTVPPLAAGAGIKFDGERISTAAAPRNLLDNSYFLNPVNQRGLYEYTGATYTVDRWRTLGENDAIKLSGSGVNVVGQGLFQYLEKGAVQSWQTYTVACEDSDGVKHVKSGVLSDGIYGDVMSFKIDGNSQPFVALNAGHTYAWAALYVGAYTADTLPAYQPKGYMCELLECKRYYQAFADNAFLGTGVVTNNYVQGYIATDVQMRVKPTLVGTIGVYNGGSTVAASELRDCSNQGCGLRVNLVLISSLGTSALCIYAQSPVSFSADL